LNVKRWEGDNVGYNFWVFNSVCIYYSIQAAWFSYVNQVRHV